MVMTSELEDLKNKIENTDDAEEKKELQKKYTDILFRHYGIEL